MCVGLVAQPCPTFCDCMECSPPGSSVHGGYPGKNIRVGCHALPHGIFPTQGSNPGLPHCSLQGSPWCSVRSLETPNSQLLCLFFFFQLMLFRRQHPCCVFTWWREILSCVSFSKGTKLIPLMRASPSRPHLNLVTSQRPISKGIALRILHWGSGVHVWILRGHKQHCS